METKITFPTTLVKDLDGRSPAQKALDAIPLLISLPDLARRFSVSRQHLTTMVADGTGPRSVRVGTKRIMFDPRDVEAWLESRKSA